MSAVGARLLQQSALGPLEIKVLEHLWDQGRTLTVREAHLGFPELAYTTVMTTLDRLFRKKFLLRHRSARAFAYEPRCTREQLLSDILSGQVADLLEVTGAPTAILSTLVRAVGRRDAALLDELDALTQAECARLRTLNQ